MNKSTKIQAILFYFPFSSAHNFKIQQRNMNKRIPLNVGVYEHQEIIVNSVHTFKRNVLSLLAYCIYGLQYLAHVYSSGRHCGWKVTSEECLSRGISTAR